MGSRSLDWWVESFVIVMGCKLILPPPVRRGCVSRQCDLEAALNNPTEGWPARNIMFPQVEPTRGLPDPSPPLPPSEGLSPDHVFARDGADPASVALVAGRAQRVGFRTFCMLDGVGDLGTPSSPKIFELWRIDNRPADSGQHDWRGRVRLGPHSDGTLAASMPTLPPDLRRADARRLRQFFPERDGSGIRRP